MKISVITVSYNSGRTIGDTLRSIATQRHHEVEHIIIDGGSSDDTLDQIRRFGSDGARLVSEPDLGIYDAMNKGLRLASGAFVGFLNADDLFAGPSTLATMSAAMAHADIVYGDLVYVDPVDTQKVVRNWRAGHFTASRLGFGWMPPHPTFYFRRERWPDLAFNLRYRIAADYDFMLRCLLQTGVRATYLPQVLVRMRTGGASNHSLLAMWRKSREDLMAVQQNGVGGWPTLVAKNLRKLPQFVRR